jgi:hypothetical protein
MMFRLAMIIVGSVAMLPVAASEPRDICDAPPQIAQQFGMTYREALRQARARQEQGLAVLFRMSTSSQLDGAWAECYASNIRMLLDVWGDKPFAMVLRKQPASVRKAEFRVLRDAALMDFSQRFPETFGASYP